MKKDKQKSVKAARKIFKKDLKLNLVAKLKEVINDLGHRSEKLQKEIDKSSDKLAKKLSKKMKAEHTDRGKAVKEQHNPDSTTNSDVEQNQASSNPVKNSVVKSKSGSKVIKKVKQEA